MSIAGLEGYEMFAEKKYSTGDDIRLYIVILTVERQLYYRMTGVATASDMPTYLPEFQKIALRA
jgi:hypothetical protein